MKQQTASALTRRAAFAGELDRLSGLALAASKDFNDELTFILNHADTALVLLGEEHPAGAGLRDLQRSALRCAEITRCLLRFTLHARDAVRYAKVRTGHAHPGDRDFV